MFINIYQSSNFHELVGNYIWLLLAYCCTLQFASAMGQLAYIDAIMAMSAFDSNEYSRL
jgi:hypothetical protein